MSETGNVPEERPGWLVAWAGDEQTALVEVTAAGAAAEAVGRCVPQLVQARIASRIAGQDSTIWGPEAASEAAIRLGWTGLAESSRPLVEPILALREELAAAGVDRVVLCGMGGSSLAPEVIAATAGVPLVVLDGTDPGQVRSALVELARTVVVVSSKSGSTVETDSQKRAFEAAFTAAGIDPVGRIVVVTDPGSPMEAAAKASGYRIFNADPTVGGRFSALTAFGLVPCGLAGVDIAGLLDEAFAVADLLGEDADSNPALVLGAAMGGTTPLRSKLVIVEDGSGIIGFADWAEQLIAESTGKLGTGILPVAAGTTKSPECRLSAPDILLARLVSSTVGDEPVSSSDVPAAANSVTVGGPLGAQFLLWEYAVAIAGHLLGINPFDQPDVESAKIAARGLLDARPEPEPAQSSDGSVELRGTPGLVTAGDSLSQAVDSLLEQLAPDGYLAVMAYLDREHDGVLAALRDSLAERTSRPVTFGWGPRFLHSTGQFHKGGPKVGVYLQITATTPEHDDLAVPDRPFTFGQLITAQAAGDAKVLADHGRPVLRVNLTDRAAGIAQLLQALGAPSRVQA